MRERYDPIVNFYMEDDEGNLELFQSRLSFFEETKRLSRELREIWLDQVSQTDEAAHYWATVEKDDG